MPQTARLGRIYARIRLVGAIAGFSLVAIGVGAIPAGATAPGANGKIAFVSNRDGESDFDLFTMNPDGNGVDHLTNNGVTDNEPSYSPDGTTLAYTSTSGDELAGEPGQQGDRHRERRRQ